MQTVKQAEIARISNVLLSNIDVPKSITDICAKRILDRNFDKTPLSYRRTQNEILFYAYECTISYDLITGEIVKCKRSEMDLYLNAPNHRTFG